MTLGKDRVALPIAGLVAILVLQLTWLGWFLVEPLPGVGAARLRRLDLLLAADDHLRPALQNLSHVANLTQRIPIVLASLLVGAANLAVGSWIIRGLRIRSEMTTAERVALGFGLGAAALGGATLLLGRWIGLNPLGVRVALGGLVVAGLMSEIVNRWRQQDRPGDPNLPRWSVAQLFSFAFIVGPFLLLMGLGAMLPTIEFDALEYHLQAPKEYFLAGRIGFLPHNVYASMPSGVEMGTTLTMEVLGDWWLGALAGQELIAWCAPASAVLIASAATRLAGSSRAGWFAALVYLTTPWIIRVGNTPFVEGPLCFSHAALVWAFIRLGDRLDSTRAGLLVGLLAGGAFAIKYPALISAVVPAALVVLVIAIRQRSSQLVLGFVIGLGLMVAPWFGKNWADTGNPVYPLAWSIFGGTEWDTARDARWQGAHGPRPIAVDLLIRSALDVAGRSDWQSPLYAALVPLAWMGTRGRRSASVLAVYAAYLFLTWWLLTHRLDRFWLPMLPALAILAGVGAESLRVASRGAAACLVWILIVAIGSNATLCMTELCGPTAWTGDLATVRDQTARDGTPSLARLDEVLPANARPLVIGQAGTFGLRHPPLYSTVFNRDIFETIVYGRSLSAVHRSFRIRKITHVYVDWAEIERYRKPGNYGFSDFEQPAVFENLIQAGILANPVSIGPAQVLYEVR